MLRLLTLHFIAGLYIASAPARAGVTNWSQFPTSTVGEFTISQSGSQVCELTTFRAGAEIHIYYHGNGIVQFGLLRLGRPQPTQDIIVEFDFGDGVREGSSRAQILDTLDSNQTGFLAQAADAESFLLKFATSENFTVLINRVPTYDYSLRGSREAVMRLAECVVQINS